MSRKLLTLSLIAIALAAGGWWWKNNRAAPEAGAASGNAAASAQAASGPGGRPATQSVGVISAQKQEVPVSIEASGTVAALNTVDLRAQTTSTVKEVLIRDGQSVRKGDLLFRFDDRADRANLDKARAQLARDRATLNDLERQYQRAQELRAQNFIAQNAVDTAFANLDAQRALLQSDQAAVQAAQVALSYNEIRAPLSGRAGVVNVVAGSLVQANSTALPLVSIAQLDPISVSFALPESQLAPLLQATRGGASGAAPRPLEAQVLLPGARPASEPARGRVSFVDNLVDTATGTIKVKAEFDNKQQTLWPGQYVRMRMILRTIKDAVVIPQAAIIQRGNERVVYIVDENKQAQLKTIQLRYPFGELAVVDGIEAGAKVVLDGRQNLRPGTPVREQPAAINPAAQAARRAASAQDAAATASAPASSGASAP
ncbi:efflux RND transporter periplasmic adaptor subunit [Roseateles violae]|uniref:Efflux RND transporter periplasmic adaptor subunit n=1 Tax=Roseateles violae TaxID=3058042 RepID=A0ABT8DMT9_9BURK|nr:efflux RND transporter periplasmic adaptor subunit [Pelomonas sp. PFR6]MDN3919704.1 efflux RND transporter periplasmic adaptor subunit [Pelomonas sp. PFR6]